MDALISKLLQHIHWDALLSDMRWSTARHLILQRDSFTCTLCGSNIGVTVHHKQFTFCHSLGRILYPWEYPSCDVATVCANCLRKGQAQFAIPLFHLNILNDEL